MSRALISFISAVRAGAARALDALITTRQSGWWQKVGPYIATRFMRQEEAGGRVGSLYNFTRWIRWWVVDSTLSIWKTAAIQPPGP